MIPLWASAIFPVQSTCGWAFTFDGAPWVAHRVWAKPVEPFNGGSCASRFAMKPLSFMTCRALPTIATPALSWPRYSRRLRPSSRIGRASRRPAYPTIPHIYRTTAPEGIVPRSFAPDPTRARSFTTVPAAALTPFAISTSSPMSAPICGTECHAPSMFTSPSPEAARKPARATTPDPHGRFDCPRAALGGRLQGRRVEAEQVPGVQRVDPRAFRGNRRDRGALREHRDGAREIVLAFLREPFDLVEDPGVEDVGPGVDEVRDDLGRLLRDRHEHFAAGRDDAITLRPFALRDEHRGFRRRGEEVFDEPPVDHVAPVEDDERVLEVSAGFPDCMGGSELFRLCDVSNVGPERLPVLEVRLDPLPPIPDNEDQVAHAVLGEGLHDVLQEGAVPHGDHDFRDRRGEGTHPGAFPRGEDDSLHARCTCRGLRRAPHPRCDVYIPCGPSCPPDSIGPRGERTSRRSDITRPEVRQVL